MAADGTWQRGIGRTTSNHLRHTWLVMFGMSCIVPNERFRDTQDTDSPGFTASGACPPDAHAPNHTVETAHDLGALSAFATPRSVDAELSVTGEADWFVISTLGSTDIAVVEAVVESAEDVRVCVFAECTRGPTEHEMNCFGEPASNGMGCCGTTIADATVTCQGAPADATATIRIDAGPECLPYTLRVAAY